MFKNIRDVLALLLGAIIIPAILVLASLGWAQVPEWAVGMVGPIWTLIIQFYFRKKGPIGST